MRRKEPPPPPCREHPDMPGVIEVRSLRSGEDADDPIILCRQCSLSFGIALIEHLSGRPVIPICVKTTAPDGSETGH